MLKFKAIEIESGVFVARAFQFWKFSPVFLDLDIPEITTDDISNPFCRGSKEQVHIAITFYNFVNS